MQAVVQVATAATASPPDAGCPAQLLLRPRAITRELNSIRGLTNVSRDELCHLEHADLALAVKNRSERIVGVDLSSLCLVL